MEGHRIGVISDTHGLLRPETAAVLKTCEIILHAGDVGKPEVLRQLRSIADTRAVRGNVDSVRLKDFHALEACPEDLPENLPEELETELWGFRIYMIHDKKQIRLRGGDENSGTGYVQADPADHEGGGCRKKDRGDCRPEPYRCEVCGAGVPDVPDTSGSGCGWDSGSDGKEKFID